MTSYSKTRSKWRHRGIEYERKRAEKDTKEMVKHSVQERKEDSTGQDDGDVI